MGATATNFREYLAGRSPADWYSLWAAWPATYTTGRLDEDPYRRTWLTPDATIDKSAIGVLAWAAADAETDRSGQETLSLWRPDDFDRHVLYLRASGDAGVENGLSVYLGGSGTTIEIYRLTAGSRSLLASEAFAWGSTANIWIRFRINSGTAYARAWREGTAEPSVDWTAFADSGEGLGGGGGFGNPLDPGAVGISAESNGLATAPRCYFFSYATDGGTAPGPEVIPAGIEVWSQVAGPQVELTVEQELYDLDTGTTKRLWVSTRRRATGKTDWPPAAILLPLLDSGLDISMRLGEDALFSGGASPSFGSLALKNPKGILAPLLTYLAQDRRVVVRAGLASWPDHRSFEVLLAADATENYTLADDKATVGLADPGARLGKRQLAVRRYSGIPTGLQPTSAFAVAPTNAAYSLPSFAVGFRWWLPATPTNYCIGPQRQDGGGVLEQFALFLEPDTGAVCARSSYAGMFGALFLRSEVNGGDGEDHWALYVVDGTRTAYLMVDGVVVATGAASTAMDTPAANVVMGAGFGAGVVWDFRFYDHAPDPIEASGLFSSSSAGTDVGLLSWWKCDDGVGTTVTDYGPLGNHAPITGTSSWAPTYSGEPDQGGNPRQLVLGAGRNVKALRIGVDPVAFQLGSVEPPFGASIRIRGVVDTSSSSAGRGVVVFPTEVAEPVHFDQIPQSGTADYLGGVIDQALALAQIGQADYSPESTVTLRGQLPFVGQLVTTSDATADVLNAFVASAGGHQRLDRSGRILYGGMRPPLGPPPYGRQSVLEFMGHEESRVDWPLGAGSASGSQAVGLWVRRQSAWRSRGSDPFFPLVAPSVPLLSNASSAGGLYLGLAADQIVWGQPGVADGLGNQYLLSMGCVPLDEWAYILASYDESAHTREIWIGRQDGPGLQLVATQAGLTGVGAAPTIPLTIGKTFIGGVQHVRIWDSAQDAASPAVTDVLTTPPPAVSSGQTLYARMIEGRGSTTTEVASGAVGMIRSCRWAPRRVLDFRASMAGSNLALKRLRLARAVEVRFAINHDPLGDNDFAAVDPGEIIRLKRPGESAVAGATPPPLTLESAVIGRRDAVDIATTVYARQARDWMAKISTAPTRCMDFGLTDEVWILHPVAGPAGTAAFRVVGRTGLHRPALDLWGDVFDASSGSLLLAEGDGGLLIESPSDTLLI